jgi:hypothetical protein
MIDSDLAFQIYKIEILLKHLDKRISELEKIIYTKRYKNGKNKLPRYAKKPKAR